jgi:hypothetical protein
MRMGAQLARVIEKNVERLACASLAAAIGYAVFAFSANELPQPERGMCVAVAAAISFYLCHGWFAVLAEREQSFAIASFNVDDIDAVDELVLSDADRVGIAELVLTDDDRVVAQELLLTDTDRIAREAEPLELDDILAELGPDSRVVRLFDRKAMPTPGQLKTRIDSHLDQARSVQPPQSDAAQALSDALAELRRSLRR